MHIPNFESIAELELDKENGEHALTPGQTVWVKAPNKEVKVGVIKSVNTEEGLAYVHTWSERFSRLTVSATCYSTQFLEPHSTEKEN